MAKWIFALLVFIGAGAQAHELAPQSDGCAVLNEIIYEEVTASGWGITGADTTHTNFREPSVVVCTSTAQTASKAFAAAVRAVGGDVSWRWSFDERADTCLSGFIEQCMPRNRGYPRPLGGSSEFKSWWAISDVVMRAMPEGSAADRSIFSRESMRLAVRAALQRSDQIVRVR
jgi:hypothetical protein